MVNSVTRFDEKFGIVRSPSDQGAIIYKCQNNLLIPDKLWTHDDLIYQGVADESALTDKTVDRSGIDPDSELADLIREHWGVEDFGSQS